MLLNNDLNLIQKKIKQRRLEKILEIQNGDMGYASAPSNIALLKYWGKDLEKNQIPLNSSLSYTLGGFRSFTKVTALGRFFPEGEDYSKYKIPFSFYLNDKETQIPNKMLKLIERIFSDFAPEITLKIESFNNFPTASGIASSASGYAALVGAIADLLQLNSFLSNNELNLWLSEWARLGSGSATRSTIESDEISFVIWKKIQNSAELNKETSTEKIRFHPLWSKLKHCVFVLNNEEKEISSSEGHKYVSSSPFQAIRLAGIEKKFSKMIHAIKEFDFESVAILSEEDALTMHSIMQTTKTPACYLNFDVSKCIAKFVSLRDQLNLQAFWTLDAGSNIHFLYLDNCEDKIFQLRNELEELLNKKIPIMKNNENKSLLIGKNNYIQLINKLDSLIEIN